MYVCEKKLLTLILYCKNQQNNIESVVRPDTYQFLDTLNKWYSIQMTQAHGQFSLRINGKSVWSFGSGGAEFEKVKWYQSNPWDESALFQGSTHAGNLIELKNLQVKNGISEY